VILRFVTAVLAAIACLAAPATAQQDCNPVESDCLAFSRAASADEAFLHLQTALGSLQERAQFDPHISSASVTAISAEINELQAMFTASGGAEAEPAYVENLDAAATAIVVAAGEEDAKAANELLDLIQRDFQLKLSSARATMGAQGGKPKTIPVTITPRRGTQGVSGLRVKLARGLRAAHPPTIVFGRLSNPETAGTVAPGVYLVYAYRSDAAGREVVAGKEMLDIGLQGEAKAALDLRVQ